MKLHDKLEKITAEINSGLKSKAIDRLQNLIHQNPNKIELRNRLAELYYESGFLDAAGKYWILTEPTDDRIKKCVALYEKSVSHSGHQILREIKFCGDKKELNEYAKTKLAALEADSEAKTGYVPKIENKFQKPREVFTKPEITFEDRMIDFLVYVIIGICIVLLLIGIYTIIKWIFF